ncbi:MAG: tRNA-dihydrouridine synthase [Alphaproteobacteria bacterium]
MTKVNRIILAPMEGVMDAQMRHIITQFGSLDYCVSEFVRVVDSRLPEHVFLKACPELQIGGKSNNVPLRVQLLGSHGDYLAENAITALKLGSYGVDLNFGCPAKKVNNSHGGAVLLKNPEDVYNIVKTVRMALGNEPILSAKMRLGYEDTSLAFENAKAIEEAGATELSIHGRTKQQAYSGKADWLMIGAIKKQVHIPIIANGDITSFATAQQCMDKSGCDDIMIGRGCLALPNLAAVIHGDGKLSWHNLLKLMDCYGNQFALQNKSRYYCRRIKQWLRYLMVEYPEAAILFDKIKHLQTEEAIKQQLENE